MNKIVAKRNVSENLAKFEIKASGSIRSIKPGQYVIFRIDENEPRIPLSILKVNNERETITVLVLVTDNGSQQLAAMNDGNSLFGIDGPFGIPVKTENFGTVLCIGSGLGIVSMLPVLNSLRASGNKVIAVLSANSKEGIVLETEIRAASDELLILTEDGSLGEKGSICHATRKIQTDSAINQVFAFGSAKMIKESFSLTRRYNIPMQAVLYSELTDEGGLNSIFRVVVCADGKTLCVDGVNFNAYYNSFEDMIQRFGSKAMEVNSCLQSYQEAI
jgi:NAD(P)H-flavin reductase